MVCGPPDLVSRSSWIRWCQRRGTRSCVVGSSGWVRHEPGRWCDSGSTAIGCICRSVVSGLNRCVRGFRSTIWIIWPLPTGRCLPPTPRLCPRGEVLAAARIGLWWKSSGTAARAGTVSLGNQIVLAAEILGGRRVGVRIEQGQPLMFFDPGTRELLRTRPNRIAPRGCGAVAAPASGRASATALH
ncbi:Uncharacterised protein [Mycobacteroides abscessus subsp. massiliense]|nr:Uncharacterised protein [Mycobacteroides abscessus subsp. massiliense]SLB77979.1 Uncharacterised protein [Mycobacteroides abscessus subsp. massiliense]